MEIKLVQKKEFHKLPKKEQRRIQKTTKPFSRLQGRILHTMKKMIAHGCGKNTFEVTFCTKSRRAYVSGMSAFGDPIEMKVCGRLPKPTPTSQKVFDSFQEVFLDNKARVYIEND